MGIVFRGDIVVGRVRFYVVIIFPVVGITPLLIFVYCQGNGRVQHGVDHINKRDFGYHRLEQVGPHGCHCPHQQATGAGPLDRQFLLAGVTCGNQMLRTGDEIGEGIFFVEELARFIPGAAQLTAAANMGQGTDKTAI